MDCLYIRSSCMCKLFEFQRICILMIKHLSSNHTLQVLGPPTSDTFYSTLSCLSVKCQEFYRSHML